MTDNRIYELAFENELASKLHDRAELLQGLAEQRLDHVFAPTPAECEYLQANMKRLAVSIARYDAEIARLRSKLACWI